LNAILQVNNASLQFDERVIWQNLDFEVQPGEFIALIGANGSGKSMFLKSVLAQQKLTAGSINFLGSKVRRGSTDIGYIPQHRSLDAQLPLTVFDAVRLGLDGHRFGLPLTGAKTKALVTEALIQVEADQLALKPLGELSGGEMHQHVVSELIANQAKKQGAAVIFVTHDLNPVSDYVDRVLYLAKGRYSIGTTEEVMRSEVLSDLYGTEIDVVRSQGRIVVLGAHDHDHHDDEEWV